MKMSENCNRIKKRDKTNKKKADIVYTPKEVVLDCLKLTTPFLDKSDFLLEPFSGQDAFYNEFPASNPKDWCEINRGRDYLTSNIKCDWVITNPPYSIFNDFLPKLFECKKGFCLLVNNLTITPPRLDTINQHGFYISLIYFFAIREWFGRQFYYVFEKRKDKKNLLEMKCRRKYYSVKI